MLFGYKIAAVCLSRLHEEVLYEFVEAFNESLAPFGWRVLIYMTGADLYWKSKSDVGEESIFELIDMDTTDALVVFGDKILDPDCLDNICRRSVSHNIPVFLINGHRSDCCNINFDYEAGFADVVRHLIKAHHITDFHMIAGMKDNAFSDRRIMTMQSVLYENGLTFTEKDISYGDFWSVPARMAVRRLIEEHRLPQAIVCANDTMAIAACVELSLNGYRVPQDVLVTGFDGIKSIEYSIPKLTSAECNYTELGQTAARLANDAASGKPLPQDVNITPKLILSESCGCMPKRAMDVVDFINNLNDSFNRFRDEDEKLCSISSAVQNCNSITEFTQELHNGIFYNMIVMLKKECTDFSLDPMQQHSAAAFGEELYVLCNSDEREQEGNYLPVRQLIPGLEVLLKTGKPLIFIALHHLDIPLGYICFHYQNYEHQNFLKINQIAMSLSGAAAGFRNRLYQIHLQSVLEEMYQYDALTGLYNYNAFLRQYREMQEEHCVLTLVLCDLDGLKYINDHFSHKEGDNAIAVVADAMRNACSGGLCCRYGGDEMIALLRGTHDETELRKEILGAIAIYNRHSQKPYQVSASIGICSSETEGFEQLFAQADALMYNDKRGKPHRR
ncbi:MAG: GGDEF domain-containing protein [Oscillospiraceae bacterium]|nr:GGDEF domain-containing protein [Oscillospiraceae bacterium]